MLTLCLQVNRESSAGWSGPQTAPERGELRLSAGGTLSLKTGTGQRTGDSMKKCALLRVNRSSKGVLSVIFVTFGGNECSFTLFAGSSLIHSFDVKQIVFIGLQENLLPAAVDT